MRGSYDTPIDSASERRRGSLQAEKKGVTSAVGTEEKLGSSDGSWTGGWLQAFPILNTVLPQTEHFPRVAGLPFLRVVDWGSLSSRWALHLRQ